MLENQADDMGLSERAPQNPVDNHHQSSFFLILHLGDIPLPPQTKPRICFAWAKRFFRHPVQRLRFPAAAVIPQNHAG